jgi:phospholipid/cholesterol/gamma-HCH transport system substrate-binding protein
MRRALAVGALLLVAAAAVVVLASREGESYKVRAIFDNAGFVIPGEDVKVAGVKVGTIDSVDVTEDFKAAVVLDITDEGYRDFRQDAGCIIRPQSLIGERFVECEVTQPRSAGEQPPPELARIEEGPGRGQRLLPLERNGKAVDLDLINNIMREPVRERLSIILADLGIAVAGRGGDLSAVIRRANPALKEVDAVLKILADQNRVLADLARDSDTALAPLARERRRVASAIENSSEVAQATAERRGDLAANFERLPTFLRELEPTMTRLGALSDEMTPVLTDLGAVAPDVNRMVQQLGPFATAAIPSFESLGEAAEQGTPAVIASRPVVRDLRTLARAVRPVGNTAAALLQSIDRTEGIERAMDYIFYQVAAINGFDSFGHYLRAALIVNQCSTYAIQPTFGCSANFSDGTAAAASASVDGPRDESLVETANALADALGMPGLKTEPAAAKPERRPAGDRSAPQRRRSAPRGDGAGEREPARRADPQATATPAPAAPAPTPAPTAAPPPPPPTEEEQTETLLDYLFGGDE